MRCPIIALAVILAASIVHAKTGRSYYDAETMARVQEKLEKYDWARTQAAGIVQSVEWIMQMSDEELWEFVPPPEQLRAINVCHGTECPKCGNEGVKKAGHYPWIMSRDKPFKLECPACGSVFPENDFEGWNTAGKDAPAETGERVIDKGVGWQNAEGHRFYLIPYYVFWQRWSKDIIPTMRQLGQAYLVTGDKRYAHTAAVLLARVAEMYERFDYKTQCYHEGLWGVGGRISDYIWTTGNNATIAEAYDAVWPAFDEDPELTAFLAGKGITDPRNAIEQKMLYVMVDDLLTGRAQGNMGHHQRTMCVMALVLDNDDPAVGPTKADLVNWLMAGEGRVEDLLWNGFWRDGLGGESSPSYASGWCSSFYSIAELLPRLGVDIWGNPKLKKMADIGLDMTVAGEFTPCIGDAGGVQGAKRIGWSGYLQGPAYMKYGDPRHAAAVSILGATARDLWDDPFDEGVIAGAVAEHGNKIEWKTRNIGGYGLAVLESANRSTPRAATMYYGDATGGHGHRDRLTIGMWAYGYPMLSEMGYPTPFRTPKRAGWNSNTISHYSVVVDCMPQQSMVAGDVNTLVSSPDVQVMDARAEVAYGNRVSLYRRTCALVDISDEASYLLDIFRVRGGREHHYSFHGPAGFDEFSVTGGTPGPTQPGTLAGEKINFGDPVPQADSEDGFALQLLQADGLITEGSYGETSKTGWAQFGDCILTKMQGATVTAPTSDTIAPGKYRLFAHVYDYNQGTNSIQFDLGGTPITITAEPTGRTGYRWVSAPVTTTQPFEAVTMTAAEVKETYVQINNVVITEDLGADEPIVRDMSTSGFNYIFNVRRMEPEGIWSATFAKPDNEPALTMTMPAGCVEEVILGDGVPELQPGNPEKMPWVLGHNQLTREQFRAGERLFRNYVATIEPHNGPASITSVEYLQCPSASPEAVGVLVRREGAVDIIHSAPDPTEECAWSGAEMPFSATAEFALVTVTAEGVKRAVVVNGTQLSYGGFELRPRPSPQGKVLAVDLAANSITIDLPLEAPEAFADTVVITGNEQHSTSSTITQARVEGNTTVLEFGDVLCTVGMGAVASIDGTKLTADRPLSGYGKTEGGRHAGRWLYNEDRTRGFRIGSVVGNSFALEGVEGDLGAVFADADGDGRALYWVSDIGPGDNYIIKSVTSVQK